MAKPILLQQSFGLGMKPDFPVEQLPEGAVLLMQNMIPDFEGGCSIRSGWDRVGASMGDTYAAALAFAPFAAGVQLVGITDQGAVLQVPKDDDAANTSRGTAQVPAQRPIFYRNNLYITNSNGTSSLKVYGGSSNVTAASGSPPAAMYGCVYKDHLVLARTAANPSRVWFSNGGDPATWDTAADGQWLDTSYPITGIATLRNMILVFSEEGVERIRGDIIPGVAGSDMVLEPLFATGCADAFSIAVTDEYAIFANSSGVYMTDGIGLVDLTVQGHISRYWNNSVYPYSSAFNLAGGIAMGDKYIIAIHTGSTFVTCLICDIRKRVWYEFTNVPAYMFATAPLGLASITAGDLFFAERDASYLVNASFMFNPNATQDDLFTWFGFADDNDASVTATVRTGFLRGGSNSLKRLKRAYVSILHHGGPDATLYAYTDRRMDDDDRITLGTVADTSSNSRRISFPINRRGYGVGLEWSISTTGAATGNPVQLDRFEVEMIPLEGSR
jgi:hypothetical protein